MTPSKAGVASDQATLGTGCPQSPCPGQLCGLRALSSSFARTVLISSSQMTSALHPPKASHHHHTTLVTRLLLLISTVLGVTSSWGLSQTAPPYRTLFSLTGTAESSPQLMIWAVSSTPPEVLGETLLCGSHVQDRTEI